MAAFLAEGRWPPLAGEGLSSHQLGFSSRSASRTPILTQLNEQSFVLMVFKSAVVGLKLPRACQFRV